MVDAKKFEEASAGYNIQIIGRTVFVTDAMKNHAMHKLAKLERFHNHLIDVHVTLDVNKLEHSALIIMKFDHFKVTGHASASDMYVAIDQAADKLQKQVRRWKDKIQDHTKKKMSIGEMQVNILMRPNEVAEYNEDMEIELEAERQKQLNPGKVIRKKSIPLKILTSDEAVMKMELSGDPFLIYKGEEDQKLKVIYRTKDGNYGVIRTE
ncbi:MAG: ribosome-associated translation inhibitor RaiA [Chlamydiae bacterium]|nr:ribosome-associated translation inhibitor RaiA [Chlamydiota bacterium]